MDLSYPHIEQALTRTPPRLLAAGERTPAAVALVLAGQGAAEEMLFIERARHPRDPWSGDLGFPGGKLESLDGGPRQAAERETREETGLDLADGHYLGQLDDIAGAHLPVLVSCFLYSLPRRPPLALNQEAGAAYWVPVAEVFAPERRFEAPVRFSGRDLLRPAIRLPVPGHGVLWGITYRLVERFREVLGLP